MSAQDTTSPAGASMPASAAAPDVAPGTAPASARAKPRRNPWLWYVVPGLVVAIGGYLYLVSGRYVATDNAYVRADRVLVAPQIGGRVVDVLVHENQLVKQGDVLFRLDAEPLQIAVDGARAQLAAVHDFANASRDDYSHAAASLRSSEAELRLNELEYKRQQELRARGLVAQRALDDATQLLASGRAKRDEDVATLSKTRNMLGGGTSSADVDALPAFRAAQAQVAKAELDLAHAVVRAPVDGIVGPLDLQPGEFVAVGQAAVPIVANDTWVEANFKETDLTNVEIGQPATLEVDAYPGREWHARVASISPASGAQFSLLPAQNATGNWVKIVQRIPVRFVIDPDDAAAPVLRAGMSVEVEIDTGREHTHFAQFFGGEDVRSHPVAAR